MYVPAIPPCVLDIFTGNLRYAFNLFNSVLDLVAYPFGPAVRWTAEEPSPRTMPNRRSVRASLSDTRR